MKGILAGFMVLFMLVPACFASAEEVSAQSKEGGLFDYKLLPALYKEHGQFVFSPMSLEIALAMAAEGAAGETREQLLSFMGVDGLPERDFGAYPALKVANAAIVSGKITLLDAYRDTLADKYLAQILPMDQDVVAQVNAWADEHTDGMIPKFLEEQPSDLLRLILINALALEAKWAMPFTPSTTDRTFHAPDNDVSVPFMYQSESLRYAEVDGVRAVKLPYEGHSLELLVILPEQGGMERTLERLGEEGTSWLGGFRWVDTVNLSLPKVSMQTELNLKSLLQAMGVELPFEAAADFSGMTENADLFIDEILQKVRMDIDEEGTRAAAVTAVMMAEAAVMEEPEDVVNMTVDRPYVLLLQDEGQETPFVAVVTDPSRA